MIRLGVVTSHLVSELLFYFYCGNAFLEGNDKLFKDVGIPEVWIYLHKKTNVYPVCMAQGKTISLLPTLC